MRVKVGIEVQIIFSLYLFLDIRLFSKLCILGRQASFNFRLLSSVSWVKSSGIICFKVFEVPLKMVAAINARELWQTCSPNAHGV